MIRSGQIQAPEGIGLYVENAYLTATNSDVQYCKLGLWYATLPDDYDWEHCIDVQFRFNETKTASNELSVPNEPMPVPPMPGEESEEVPEPPPPPPPEPDCPKVNWEDEDLDSRRG